MESTNTTNTVTRRRKGWIGRVRTGPKCYHEYWQAFLKVDGKTMRKTSKDRAVVEAWLRDRLREHPTYTLPLYLRVIERRRKGNIHAYTTATGRTGWRVTVTVNGRVIRRVFADESEARAWLDGILKAHPVYWCGPRRNETEQPVEVEVGTSPVEDAETLTAALPSVHIKWRPDLGLELVRGHDPADVGRALGWDAARTGRTLDLLVEKGRIVVHVTKWGPLYQPVTKKVGEQIEIQREYSERAFVRESNKRLYGNG